MLILLILCGLFTLLTATIIILNSNTILFRKKKSSPVHIPLRKPASPPPENKITKHFFRSLRRQLHLRWQSGATPSAAKGNYKNHKLKIELHEASGSLEVRLLFHLSPALLREYQIQCQSTLGAFTSRINLPKDTWKSEYDPALYLTIFDPGEAETLLQPYLKTLCANSLPGVTEYSLTAKEVTCRLKLTSKEDIRNVKKILKAVHELYCLWWNQHPQALSFRDLYTANPRHNSIREGLSLMQKRYGITPEIKQLFSKIMDTGPLDLALFSVNLDTVTALGILRDLLSFQDNRSHPPEDSWLIRLSLLLLNTRDNSTLPVVKDLFFRAATAAARETMVGIIQKAPQPMALPLSLEILSREPLTPGYGELLGIITRAGTIENIPRLRAIMHKMSSLQDTKGLYRQTISRIQQSLGPVEKGSLALAEPNRENGALSLTGDGNNGELSLEENPNKQR